MNDYAYRATNKHRAKAAWHRVQKNCPNVKFSKHYVDGWKEGYYEFSTGSDGTPPVVPPQKYWSTTHQNPNGQRIVEEWYRGFQDGVIAADREGRQHWHFIPSLAPQMELLPDVHAYESTFESIESIEPQPAETEQNREFDQPNEELPNSTSLQTTRFAPGTAVSSAPRTTPSVDSKGDIELHQQFTEFQFEYEPVLLGDVASNEKLNSSPADEELPVEKSGVSEPSAVIPPAEDVKPQEEVTLTVEMADIADGSRSDEEISTKHNPLRTEHANRNALAIQNIQAHSDLPSIEIIVDQAYMPETRLKTTSDQESSAPNSTLSSRQHYIRQYR